MLRFKEGREKYLPSLSALNKMSILLDRTLVGEEKSCRI